MRRDDEEHFRHAQLASDRFGDFSVSLYGLVAKLALLGRFKEAELYRNRLEASDKVGSWAYSASMRLRTLRGDYGSAATHSSVRSNILCVRTSIAEIRALRWVMLCAVPIIGETLSLIF